MTNAEATEKIQDFMKKCQEDDDIYFVFHVSKTEDSAMSQHFMDTLDAIALIEGIAKKFEIDLHVLAESTKYDESPESQN